MINENNLPINNYLIKNDYFIFENNFKDEFNIVIYFITNNKCKILIRRLDCIGWGQDLKIKLMDINGFKFEKVSLGSSDENLKIIEIYTNITLYENKLLETHIPKIIVQTSNDIMNKNIFHYNSIMSFIDFNPDFEYKHFFDIDIREFIINNSNEDDKKNNILEAFDLLNAGQLKADLFKYFFLYKNGGCYFDTKMILKKSLSKIINNDDKIVLICDNDNISNSVIMIEKNNIVMYNILIECVSNILNKNKGNNKQETTGNELFNKHFKNNNDYKKIFKVGDNIYHDNNLIINCFYKNYYTNYYNTEKDLEYMWINNKYFYKKANTIKNDDFEYYFYIITENNNTNNTNNNLIIIWEKNNVFKISNIENGNNNNSYIKLKVIDNIDNNIKYIDIGLLINNEKYFIIE
jgi:mannosyltransferase OCH1-like enzyme